MGNKSQLSHYQQMQLSQVKHLNDMAEAFRDRSKYHYGERFYRNSKAGTTKASTTELDFT